MALFNIEEFRSVVERNKGFLKPNRFLLSLTPPLGIRERVNVKNNIEFYCESTNMPGYQLHTHDYRRYTYGPTEKRVYGPMFQPLQLEIMADGNGIMWDFFNNWMQYIMPHTAKGGIMTENSSVGLGTGNVYELEYKTNYVTDVAIYCLHENGGLTNFAYCRDAFPSNVSDIRLHWADNNNIARFGVQLEYTDWLREPQ